MKKPILINHHIIYASPEHRQEDDVVTIFKGEHYISTQLQRRKNISEGFIKFLKFWIVMNEGKAQELKK